MIIWILTVIFSLACCGYATYRVHAKHFNLIEYFKSGNAKNRHNEYTELGEGIIVACWLVPLVCFIPIVNLCIGLLGIVTVYTIPALYKLWAWLQTIGHEKE